MAARTRKARHDDLTRQKIKTTQLCKRLTEHALGNIALEQTQVRAIEILLRKVLPDLAAVEHTGEMKQTYVAQMPAPVADLADWKAQHMDASQTLPNTDTDPTKH